MSKACGDCGYLYDGPLADHLEVCEAHTCEMCETVFVDVVPTNRQGNRVCESCLEEDDDMAPEYDSEIENDAEGAD